MKKKRLLMTLGILVLITISAILGFYFGFSKGIAAGGFIRSSGDMMARLQHLDAHLGTADCTSLENTVVDYLGMLDRNKDKEGSLVSGITYYNDKMLWNILLSQIDKTRNNETDRKKHLEAATEKST